MRKKALLWLLILTLALTLCGCKSSDYKAADALYTAGDYAAAAEGFAALGDYKDSAERAQEASSADAYEQAKALLDAGDYAEAITAFEALGGYQDSAELLTQAQLAKTEADNAAAYAQALELLAAGDYGQAIEALTALGDYQDSAEQAASAEEAAYSAAGELLRQGKAEEAEAVFASLGERLDLTRATALRQSGALRDLTPGMAVRFGLYEQDNDSSNGPEEIEWTVLAVEDGKAMLISRDILDMQPYHTLQTPVTWADCTLRAWLNGEFLETAFPGELQEKLLNTKILDYKNAEAEEPVVCEDRVYVLHPTEASLLLGNQDGRAAEASAYCRAVAGTQEVSWRLRASGEASSYAFTVKPAGDYCCWIADKVSGVRPVIWVDAEAPASGTPAYTADKVARSLPEGLKIPNPNAPNSDDLLGMAENVEYPRDDAFMERYWLKCVLVPVRAYLRLQPISGSEFDGYVYDAEVVSFYARQDEYSLIKTQDGRYGWITASLLKNDHP